jgi:hypothetical protein
MAALPLLVFDTNILLDVWLGRDGDQAVLLVRLAETGKIELVVPEFVLLEFRGTALRWVRDERERLNTNVRRAANEWGRSGLLSADAESMRKAASGIEATLGACSSGRRTVIFIASTGRCTRRVRTRAAARRAAARGGSRGRRG